MRQRRFDVNARVVPQDWFYSWFPPFSPKPLNPKQVLEVCKHKTSPYLACKQVSDVCRVRAVSSIQLDKCSLNRSCFGFRIAVACFWGKSAKIVGGDEG